MGEDGQPVEIVYRGMLPFSEMVRPEVPWKIGDRVESKYGDGAGTIHEVENLGSDQNVGVIFDGQPDTLAWLCDDEVRKA